MTGNEILPVVDDRTAWSKSTLAPGEGRLTLSTACRTEIIDLARLLADNPLPTVCLRPEDFELPQCRAAMTRAKAELDDGCGFVLIDRLPLEEIGRDAAIGVYWLLLAMVGRAVAQSWDGKMLYRVADVTGKPPGNGIRPDVTNAEQNFHTDNSYNLCPPEHVALLCLHPARSGGISRVASLHSAHNLMHERHADLLARLYQPVFFDRQREHAEDDIKVIERPVLQNEHGRLRARLSGALVRQGYALAGQELDPAAEAAIAAFYEILNDPALYKEFFFEPGQIQIIDNRYLAHKRTRFEDWPEPERRRELIRIWLRGSGRPFYNG